MNPTTDPIEARLLALRCRGALFDRAATHQLAGKIDRAGFDRCVKFHLGKPVMATNPARIAAAVDEWVSFEAKRPRTPAAPGPHARGPYRRMLPPVKAAPAIPAPPAARPPLGGFEHKAFIPSGFGHRAGPGPTSFKAGGQVISVK